MTAPTPSDGLPSKDVMGKFDVMREEYLVLRAASDEAVAKTEAKFAEIVAFAQANGIHDDPGLEVNE